MKHLTFYYAIGFVVIGVLMLLASFLTFIGMLSPMNDPFDTSLLGLAMILPFVISMLSWRDWGKIRTGKEAGQEG
jgi:Sec-independent protein secretion pathway component TatC